MPSVINGAFNGKDSIQNLNINYSYDGVDLRPGSKLSQKIITTVVKMAEDSYRVMEQRHKVWNSIDETLKVYIPLSDYEKAIKKKDVNKPVSIVVPYSYATLETLLAYMTRAYLGSPVFQYEGVGPEDTIGGKLMELAVQQQVHRFKSILDMHTSIRDGFAYGLGVSTMNWKERRGMKTFTTKVPKYSGFGNIIGESTVQEKREALLFEGNEVVTIDPYRFLPDPNTSIHDIQSMEYVGWLEFKSFYKLLADEAAGALTNVKYLKQQGFGVKSSRFTMDPSKRILNRDDRANGDSTKYVTLINMYVTLIPKDWGLEGTVSSDGEFPEIWLFTIANESIVLRAQPLGLDHGMYPVASCAPDFDGYSITPLSRMEMESGLQTTLNWMFNSHVANVRKAINDMFIVDPSLVNMEDLKDPEPGKLIRLRRSAWGRGVEGAIKQFNVNDITRSNMQDAEQIMNMMSRVSAASDATQGIMQQGRERVTAAEYQGTVQMAISRIERLARMVSVQYLQDLAYFHASHTQQLMTKDTFARISGEWPANLTAEFQGAGYDIEKPMVISPSDIQIDFDLVFKDGNTATADAMANDFWTKSFQTIGASPELNQQFDIGRIFMHMARLNGAKNVHEFIRNGGVQSAVNPMANQDVAQGAAAGNLVPVEELLAGLE